MDVNNPGSYQIRKRSIAWFLKKQASKLRRGNFRGWYYFVGAEGRNIYNNNRMGKQFYCSCCNHELSYLLHTANNLGISLNSACPNCDSRKRHRGLFLFYKEILAESQQLKVLHFAPEAIFKNLFDKQDYVTTDFFQQQVDLPGLDIQDLKLDDNSFDLLICNHVLEHVEDDNQAIKEIYRILTSQGKALITVPGDWNRNENFYFKDLSNNGHYRDYGQAFKKQLEAVFDRVTAKDLFKYNKEANYPMGLEPNKDVVFVCERDF